MHSAAVLRSRGKERYSFLFSDSRGVSSALLFPFRVQYGFSSFYPVLQIGFTKIVYLCGMKKLLCPQCKIAAMYVKNEQGERLLVYVLENGEVVPKYPEDSMEGFDLTEVFCLGCSWHGSPKRLVKR